MAERKRKEAVPTEAVDVDSKAAPGIKQYLLAGYPCLFLPTVEPEVAEKRVKEAMIELNMQDVPYGVWKSSTGMMMGKCTGSEKAHKTKDDLLDVLAEIEKYPTAMVGIFYHVRQFLTNYQVIQQLSDTIMAARLKLSHVILVGSHLDLPPELKNLVTFVDCPLPTKTQIAAEYKKLAKAYESEITIPKEQKEFDELITDAATAAIGLDMIGAENALALSLAVKQRIDVKIISAQKEQEVRKSDVLEFIRTDETLESVGGFSELKAWLLRRRRAFTQEARDYGLPYPKGMLLVGPAGTGKSLAAKAIASFLKIPLLRLDMGKIFRSLVGESEAAIRQALQVAEAVAPVVLWMDEIDKGLAGMKGSGELDSGVTSRVVSTILTWRQETQAPVMLTATANDVAAIPSMVYRKGRLDEVWATDLPFEDERIEIFNIHLLKRKRNPVNFDVKLLAKRTEQYTGSEIEACIEDAMFSAFDEEKEVDTAFILKAVSDTVAQAIRDAEELTAIREWVSTRARLVSGKKDHVPLNSIRPIRGGKKKEEAK
jgi:ATP-dependent 26S proteasome regulatory subunit